MAKLTMKYYENFLEEEARQARLQEELEDKRDEEAYEAEANWHDWQRKQEEERRWEELNRYPEYDGYFDPDDFDDDFDDDSEDDDYDDDLMDELSESIFLEECDGAYTSSERLAKKSVARNRHHAAEKAKKRAKESARILERRYWKGCFRLPYEEYRLATRALAAIKKANRVKVQTA